MPVSDPSNITPIVKEIVRINPATVLDLGIGVGLYGLLCRQYLDIAAGRIHREEWKKIICGVEGWKDYANPVWDMYTTIENDDFSDPEHIIRYEGFDLVLMLDSLEHIETRVGHFMLDALIAQNRHVIVSVPVGINYLEQGAVNGNELERHKTKWTEEEFTIRGGRTLHSGVCCVSYIPGRYGK